MSKSLNSLVVRGATPDDAEVLTALARRAKASWGYPEEWLQAWGQDLTISEEYIRRARVFVATISGAVAGTIGVNDGADGPEIGHAWVDPSHQAKGVGRALMNAAFEEARRQRWDSLRVESDPNATGFYQRFGAVTCGEVSAPVLGTTRALPVLMLKVPPK